MATMTGLDAATRARLIREYGATAGFLEYLEEADYAPERIALAFRRTTVERLARHVGYDLESDPDYQAPAAEEGAAPAARTPAHAGAPKAGARAPGRKRPMRQIYRTTLDLLSLLFVLGLALLIWRVDGYFGVAFLQQVPGLATMPNSFLWPPNWTWLIGLGVSAVQAAFWPHGARYDDRGIMVEAGSSVQEILTWLVILALNIASSALGMVPTIAGLNLGGLLIVPEEGRGLMIAAWVAAIIFAFYPEWASKVFGAKLWDLLVPDSLQRRIAAVRRSLAAARGVLAGMLPSAPRSRG